MTVEMDRRNFHTLVVPTNALFDLADHVEQNAITSPPKG